ncbi:hypothetical protein OSTOST_01296 [Ostertagia ostertagi]
MSFQLAFAKSSLHCRWFCGGLSMYMIDLNGEDMTKNFWLGQYMSAALASIIRVVRRNHFGSHSRWFCGGLSMYMIDLNGEDMTKNFWLGQYMSAALASIIRVVKNIKLIPNRAVLPHAQQIFGFADAYFPRLGRRTVYIISMSICIFASIGLMVQLYAGGKGTMLYFITYLTAYNSISLTWEPNFLGAAELMPTDVRAKTTALLNIISRLANVLASQMIYFKTIYEPAIMIVLMISNILSFVVTTTWLKVSRIKIRSAVYLELLFFFMSSIMLEGTRV